MIVSTVIRRSAIPFITGLLLLGIVPANAQVPADTLNPDEARAVQAFLQLLIGDAGAVQATFESIDDNWHPGFVAMSLETLSLSGTPAVRRNLLALLERKTGQEFGNDLSAWYRWLWNRPEQSHPAYAEFKAALYALIDPAFGGYFGAGRPSEIRLDEIRWGGVRQDGIPPLRGPKMLSADDAGYLDDDNVVFGIEINGDARAYPKRILAWHEMFVDEVGGVPVAGVYCTLCGTMILYRTEFDGVDYALGTSGFLYRSNKLMYDRGTQSLWNTLWGRPVVGPLVGRGIELEYLSVVTTDWGTWRARHPETLVLSLDTGYVRDYSEGAAYREYFATDELMFTVPTLDRRLKNKAEILALQRPGMDIRPLAVSSEFLRDHPVYHDRLGDLELVVLTDRSGAHRAYVASGVRFVDWDGDATVTDAEGASWTLSEDRLTRADGETRARFPAHRAFWFGWFAAYPETRLVY